MRHLLLLHGAIGSRSQLTALEKQLEADFMIHSVDFPGHGGSALPEEFSIDRFSEFVREHCLKNGIASLSLFGYSMGGYVALYLARQQPSLIDRVITLATKFQWDEETAQKESRQLQPDLIEQKLPLFARALEQRHAPQDWKEVLKRTSAMLLSMGKSNPLKPEDYAQLNQPVLLLLGDRDRMVSLEETQSVFRQLPQAQLSVLPSTPHPVDAVDPKLLAFLIKRFLKE